MRKIILICFTYVFMVLTLCSCGPVNIISNENESVNSSQENIYTSTNTDSHKETKSNKDVIEIVNRKISELTESNDYVNADTDGRKKLAFEALSKLSDSGYIKGQYYDEENRLFSFQYIDGTLGGIEIVNDFSSEIDGLFIN